MNIRKFKEGDIITRNEPMVYAHNKIGDGSYLGERLKFLGFDEDSKVLFFQSPDGFTSDNILDLSFGRDAWDEGWCYYPETLWQRLVKQYKKITNLEKPNHV